MSRTILIILLLLIMVTGTFLWLNRINLMEKSLTDAFQTTVDISAMDITPRSIVLKNMKILNVSPMNTTYAFTARTVVIRVPIYRWLFNTVEIDFIRVESPQFFVNDIEESGVSNFNALLSLDHEKNNHKTFKVGHLSFLDVRFFATKNTDEELTIRPIPFIEWDQLPKMTLNEMWKKTAMETLQKRNLWKSGLPK